MKIRTCAALLIAAIMLIFSGCSLWTVEEQLDAVEDAVEIRMDAVEEAAEAAVREALLPEPEPLPQESITLAAKSTPPAAEPNTVETAPPVTSVTAALTKEEAEAIALNHAGFSKDQISYLHTEYEIDDRIPQYDIDFREGYWEYEYEIHAETGAILSFEKDD